MRFEQFLNFTRDFDIFPKLMSKASLYRIFKALALMNDAMSPKKQVKKQLTMSSFTSLSPKNQQLLAFKNELIDENLFIEALTLCALDSSHDILLIQAVEQFDPRIHEEPNKETLKVCLKKCIEFVEHMYQADGVFASVKEKKTIFATMMCNMQDKKDLISGFKSNPSYKWYFRESKSKQKRFEPKKIKMNFDSVMRTDSALKASETNWSFNKNYH